jgi:hypothetical protein
MSSGGHPLDIGTVITGMAVGAADGSAGGIAGAASVAGVELAPTRSLARADGHDHNYRRSLRLDRGTLVEGSKADARPDGKGGYLIVLSHAILDRLKTMRGPGESYSDVILRVARGE